jgi:DNA repair protein RadC
MAITPTLRELTVRYTVKTDANGDPVPLGPPCTTPEASATMLTPLLQAEPSEVFVILCLTTRYRVIASHEVSRGTLSSTRVEPREIFRAALLANAAAIILGHNHPSGDPTPSGDDHELTRRIISAGRLLGVDVLDHVVIAGDRFISLRQTHGRLFDQATDPLDGVWRPRDRHALVEHIVHRGAAVGKSRAAETFASSAPTRHLVDSATTLRHIVDIMYGDGPDEQWDAETIERVAEVLNAAGLVPSDDGQPPLPCRPVRNSWTHRRTACEEALAALAAIRNQLRNVGANRARQAVARAMKSVDGARRHACRFEA